MKTRKLIQKRSLIEGYAKQYHPKVIPKDVLSLCLDMYGMDDFLFNIESTELRKLLSKEIVNQFSRENNNNNNTNNTSYQWNMSGVNNNSNTSNTPETDVPKLGSYDSQIFENEKIKYKLLIQPDSEANSNNNNSYNSNNNNPSKVLQLHIKIIDPFSQHKNKNKIAKIILFCIVRCKQLKNMEVRFILNSEYDFTTKNEITKKIKYATISVNDLTQFNEFQFMGTLDIIHMEIIDHVIKNITNKLYIYHQNVKLSKNIRYKWQLNKQLIPSKQGTYEYYYSECFDNNNWFLSLSFHNNNNNNNNNNNSNDVWSYSNNNNNNNNINVKLYLMRLPVNVKEIQIYWRIELKYKNITYCQGNINTLSHSSTSYRWSNDGHYIGSIGFHQDVFKQDTINKLNLDLVQITVYIDIFKIYKQNYYEITDYEVFGNNAGGHNTFNNNNNNGDVNRKYLVNKERYCSYGITKNYKIKMQETLSDKLYLQNEISFNDEERKADNHTEFEMKYNDCYNDNDDLSDSMDELDDIKDNLLFKNENKRNENINGYEWIEKTLKKLQSKNFDKIIGLFKTNEVNDSRLNYLEHKNWDTLIPQIGIRNEMRYLLEKRNNKISKEIEKSNTGKANKDWVMLMIGAAIITQVILLAVQICLK